MLIKKQFAAINITHISLTAAGLMWVMPFLYYEHAYPITTFYQEWLTAVLALVSFTLLLNQATWQAATVPRILLLPIGLLMLMVAQYMLGRIDYFDHMMLVALYLLLSTLLMWVGQRIRVELGLPMVVTVLAGCLVTGAELNVLAGMIQHYHWQTFLNSMVTMKVSSAVYGNIAQANQFADYLTLGLISLGLLYATRKLPGWTTTLLAIPMMYALVLSGSRSPWLYLLVVAVLSLVLRRRVEGGAATFRYALWLLLGYAAMHFAAMLPALQGAGEVVTSGERLLGDNASGKIRWHLWREAIEIFLKYPLMGAGAGQFAWEQVQLASIMKIPSLTQLYNNAHNLTLQLAVEMGALGVGVLMYTTVVWIRQAWKAGNSVYHWWGYAVMCVLAIHSHLEYPLWYAYFLGIAALVLGMFDETHYRLDMNGRVGRVAMLTVIVLGAGSLLQLYQGYRHMETALLVRTQAATEKEMMRRVNEELVQVYNNPLLKSYAEQYIASAMDVNEERLPEKVNLAARAERFIPTAVVLYHHAFLLAQSGREPEAMAQLERSIWAYPDNYPAALVELKVLASKDPARFSSLLEFASQKHEEYQRAAIRNE